MSPYSPEEARAHVESEAGRLLSFRIELQARLAHNLTPLLKEQDPSIEDDEMAMVSWIGTYAAVFSDLLKDAKWSEKVKNHLSAGHRAIDLSPEECHEWQEELDNRLRHSIH